MLVSTLGKLAADARDTEFEPPAIVVIGEIVTMRARLLAAERAAADGGLAVTARGLIIAAPHSGAGKTTVTLGLLAALRAARRRGARGKGRARLHRSGVPCGGDRRAERQSRFLGDAAGACSTRWPRRPPAAPTCS